MRALLALGALLATPAAAQTQGTIGVPPANYRAPDYSLGQNWLCLPDQRDACDVPLDVTDVAAAGTLTRTPIKPAASPAFDCFYVYPTVSFDPTPNSDLVDNEEERRVALLQAAPFQQNCRMFAPMYRQVTLTTLREAMAGRATTGDRALGYADVKAAWDEYMRRWNGGRGVVLIGHSQGAGMLKTLVQREIDGKPAQRGMIAAYLIGHNVAVPRGREVGGDFKRVPLCRSADQTGCVVSFVSFRAASPPPANSRFGRIAEPAGMSAACVDPAALLGRSTLDSWHGSGAGLVSTSAAPQAPWTRANPSIATAYVRTPGLVRARCVSDANGSYLSVTLNADPNDPRVDELAGDVVASGQVLRDWGLHLVDMNLAMGDMVALSARQAAAWGRTKR